MIEESIQACGLKLRGGAFNNNEHNLRAANRNNNPPDNRNNNIGFRCLRDVEPMKSYFAGSSQSRCGPRLDRVC